LNSAEGLLLPPFFAFGTGLPVVVFSVLIAFSLEKVGQAFQAVRKIEKVLRYLVASVFILAGLYYLYLLVKFINI
jgi:threonine/homoserine/homoserine lactone efflux protein